MTNDRGSRADAGLGGFTLVETLFSVLIIGVLLGLLLFGLRAASNAGRAAAERQNVQALKLAADQFRQEFGFAVPLVRDMHPDAAMRRRIEPIPGGSGNRRIAVYDTGNPTQVDILRGSRMSPPIIDAFDYRFSRQSLPYYLLGALNEPLNVASETPDMIPIDGVAGPGFLKPRPDGTFEIPAGVASGAASASKRTGIKHDPLFVASSSSVRLVTDGAAPSVVELRDRQGKAYRFYRWARGQVGTGIVTTSADLNVPLMLGDPAENPELRNADWAIVAAGPDGVFGDEDLLDAADPERMTASEIRIRLKLDPTASPSQVRNRASADNIVAVGVSQ